MTSGLFRSSVIDLDGPVHVADFGGRGKPLILVHGLGGSHVNWLAAAPLLARRHRVLALDLPGFGRTPLAGRSATVEANQGLIDRFLSRFVGEPAWLAGNSMGGLLSLLQADANPQSVRGIALVNAAMPHPSTWSIDPQVLALFAAMVTPGLGELFLWAGNELRTAERAVKEMFAICCADATRLASDIIHAHVQLLREHAAQKGRNRAHLQAARSLVRVLFNRERFRAVVHRVRAPTLVIAGAQDRLVRLAAAEAVARMRPDWRFVPLAHVGHVPQLEDPAQFADIVTRWTREAGAAARRRRVQGLSSRLMRRAAPPRREEGRPRPPRCCARTDSRRRPDDPPARAMQNEDAARPGRPFERANPGPRAHPRLAASGLRHSV